MWLRAFYGLLAGSRKRQPALSNRQRFASCRVDLCLFCFRMTGPLALLTLLTMGPYRCLSCTGLPSASVAREELVASATLFSDPLAFGQEDSAGWLDGLHRRPCPHEASDPTANLLQSSHLRTTVTSEQVGDEDQHVMPSRAGQISSISRTDHG